jgi:hypothetical protein
MSPSRQTAWSPNKRGSDFVASRVTYGPHRSTSAARRGSRPPRAGAIPRRTRARTGAGRFGTQTRFKAKKTGGAQYSVFPRPEGAGVSPARPASLGIYLVKEKKRL